MGNKTLTHALLYLLIGLVFGIIIFSVLFGKNGLIKQEIEKYNETHTEERQENAK